MIAAVLAAGLAVGGSFLAASQRDIRDRSDARLLASAEGDADFTEVAIADLGRQQARAAQAVVAGPDPTDEALGAVAAALDVGFALLLDADGELLATYPTRELDAAQLVASFEHLRRALAGEVGVSAALDAPTFASGVAIAVAAPFAADDGSRRVISTAFDRDSTVLGEYLTRTTLTPSARTWLVDREGRVVASGANADEPPPIDAVTVDRATVLDSPNDPRVATRTAVEGTPWWVLTTAPTAELYAPVQGWSRWQPWGLLALAGIGGALLVLLLARYRHTADQLQAANEELEAAAARTREFVAIASHELRTPAAILTGYAESLGELWPTMEPEQRSQYAGRMVRAARRLSHLLDALLMQALSDREQLSLDVRSVSVREAIADAIEAADVIAGDTRLDVPLDLDVRADPTHLTRVLVNLLENATKYGRPPVDIRAWRNTDEIHIEVRDHGDGVPPSFAPRLFERFSRASAGGPGPGGDGAGLGLSVAQGVIVQMQGSLEYAPAEPGSRFTITLPMG